MLHRKSPSSGIYSGSTSAGSPSPVPVSTTTPTAMARPQPLQAWSARQAVSQPPIIMQSVKSTQVQKPVLQTATAPPIPASPTSTTPPATCAPPPSYMVSIQQKAAAVASYANGSKPAAPLPAGVTAPVLAVTNSSPVTVPTTEPPSYASTMQAKVSYCFYVYNIIFNLLFPLFKTRWKREECYHHLTQTRHIPPRFTR